MLNHWQMLSLLKNSCEDQKPQQDAEFIGPAAEELDDKIIELIETEIKYEGYIK